jgi:uncharacterized protein YndB with AHSA1/START domain
MPTLTLSTHAAAPVEEVWKLLHDPARFPEWWDGVATVAPGPGGEYTMWPEGYPDFPMAQRVQSASADGRVTISCLVSDLVFTWQLRAYGEATGIDVAVEIPEREAHREPDQRRLIERSLANLAALAASSGGPAGVLGESRGVLDEGGV